MVDGTLGVYLANSWKEIGAGVYQWCPPDAVIVANTSTIVRAVYGSNRAQHDTIEARLPVVDSDGAVELDSDAIIPVNVLPATGIVADRSPGVTLYPAIGETVSQSITLYETDGTTPVDLSGKTLAIIFETMKGTDVAVVDDSDITVSGTDDNVVTFAYPAIVTATRRTLRFALRDAASPKTMYLQGLCSVVSAPQVDVP